MESLVIAKTTTYIVPMAVNSQSSICIDVHETTFSYIHVREISNWSRQVKYTAR